MKIIIIILSLSLMMILSSSWVCCQENTTKYQQSTGNMQNNADINTPRDIAKKTAISKTRTETEKNDEPSLHIGINKVITLLEQIKNSNGNVILWVQAGIFLLQLGVFGWQGIQLRRTVAVQRAWVFAGIGGTKLVRPNVVRAHPDYRNNGASPAFVEYVCIDFWPKSKPLPQTPEYRTKYPIMNPIQPDKKHEPIFKHEVIESDISEDTYVYGRIYYLDAFEKETQRYSSFIYLIKLDMNGDHIRPLRDEVPIAYWDWI